MDTTDLFSILPPSSNIWIFVGDRPISQEEGERLLATTRVFTSSWVSHGRRVIGESTILDERFLLLAGFVEDGDLSGCGIDASFRAVAEVGEHMGIHWLPPLTIAYRDGAGHVQTVTRAEFRALGESGNIVPQTPVFDTSLATLQEVRDRFETPVSESWHARLLPDVVPS